MKMQDIAVVKRDVEVTLVPYGQSVTLVPGTEVLVTQSLGGSFTLNVNGNLVRLDGKDADAIGKTMVMTPADNLNISEADPLEESMIWDQLKMVFDPEIPVNIVDLGLIYDLTLNPLEEGGYHVAVQMTLTAPGCGMGPVIVQDAESKIMQLPNVKKADAILVFDPPWNSEMMSDAAKLELGVL